MSNGKEISPTVETVLERPCLTVELLVQEADLPESQKTEDPGVKQYYHLYQGTLIPLYYGENICGRKRDEAEKVYGPDCLLGYLLETGGKCCFFSMKPQEEPVMLEPGGKPLRCADLELQVLRIDSEQEERQELEPARRKNKKRRTHGI